MPRCWQHSSGHLTLPWGVSYDPQALTPDFWVWVLLLLPLTAQSQGDPQSHHGLAGPLLQSGESGLLLMQLWRELTGAISCSWKGLRECKLCLAIQAHGTQAELPTRAPSTSESPRPQLCWLVTLHGHSWPIALKSLTVLASPPQQLHWVAQPNPVC